MALKLSTLLTFTNSKLISSRSLNTSNVRGLEMIFFKPAILFDFPSNVLLRSLSVLSLSSGAEIIVENKWQGILRLFQRIEFSMFLGYLESIGKVRERFLQSHFKPSGKKKPLYLPPSPSEICPFHTPLPLGISVTLRGGGYGYFLEPHILFNLLAKSIIQKQCARYMYLTYGQLIRLPGHLKVTTKAFVRLPDC